MVFMDGDGDGAAVDHSLVQAPVEDRHRPPTLVHACQLQRLTLPAKLR